jgi:hypothetical protein
MDKLRYFTNSMNNLFFIQLASQSFLSKESIDRLRENSIKKGKSDWGTLVPRVNVEDGITLE